MIRPQNIKGIILFLVLAAGCTTQFFPDFDQNQEQLVVEGLITDQNEVYRVKLSKSLPVGKPLVRKPVKGATVTIMNEDGIIYTLKETLPGIYSSDSTKFRGQVGGKYSLNIRILNANYSTDFIEMKPVPPISSVYYEKVTIKYSQDSLYRDEGCKIYLDTYDPSGECLYYRWDYTETYEYQVPYDVWNKICWVTEQSDNVLIKNTSIYNQARVTKYPVLFISEETDKLKEKYSIEVKQYSMNEAEFEFWETVQNISQNVGSLYDITPVAIPSNIRSDNNPEESVLGYFSVSAVAKKRLFIEDQFLGWPNFYSYCATDTIYGNLPPEGLNINYWVIEDYGDETLPFWVVTTYRECADCTTKGTKVMPSFWNEH
jgi:hypothetical protein